MSFDEWTQLVDDMFFEVFGVYSNTFEDWTWMEAFDLGKTPDQAFRKWAEETGHDHLI